MALADTIDLYCDHEDEDPECLDSLHACAASVRREAFVIEAATTPAIDRERLARALNEPGPNVSGCTCDRDDDSNDDGPIALCPMHEDRLRFLRWDTLAGMVIDLSAALANIAAALAEDTGETP
jgi:hypothetical protein